MPLTAMGRLGSDPFAEMRRMQSEMNRLFAEADVAPTAATFPPVNVWVGEDSAVVTAELPGVAEADLSLTIREDTLTIQGKREPLPGADQVAWHRQERAYGSFSRVVGLPFRVDAEKAKARLANGILELELQRPQADKPRRIQVTAS